MCVYLKNVRWEHYIELVRGALWKLIHVDLIVKTRNFSTLKESASDVFVIFVKGSTGSGV